MADAGRQLSTRQAADPRPAREGRRADAARGSEALPSSLYGAGDDSPRVLRGRAAHAAPHEVGPTVDSPPGGTRIGQGTLGGTEGDDGEAEEERVPGDEEDL